MNATFTPYHGNPTLTKPIGHLPPREREVLEFVAEGQLNQPTASELGIRIQTIEKHRERLTGRLGIHGIAVLTHFAIVLGLVALSPAACAKEMTGFELAKEGNRYIGEQSKDKVVQIRSEKPIASLTPDLWHVVYYDPDATLKAVEVTFGAGKKMEVKRPVRLLEPITKGDEPLAPGKLKVDSDTALAIAKKQPLLGKLTLKASRLVLERRGMDDATPVWKIRLWAAKLENPNENADVGEVVISAEDGTVLKSDLKPAHVD